MAERSDNRPLSVTEFTPLDGAGHRSKFKFSYGYLVLGLALGFTALVLLYLFLARAVIFKAIQPMQRSKSAEFHFILATTFYCSLVNIS